MKPGTSAIGSYLPVFQVDESERPRARFAGTQSLHRHTSAVSGAWTTPEVITSPDSTSTRMPPLALFGRQPPGSFVSPSSLLT